MALALLMKHRPHLPRQSDPKVIALSHLLNEYSAKMGLVGGIQRRNASGVPLKISKLSRHDPEDPRAGLGNNAFIEAEVWREFAADPQRLDATADAIRQAINAPEIVSDVPTPEETGDEGVQKGRILVRLHVYRERDRAIVRAKKEDVLERMGRLQCECCGFDFREFYGDRGEGFAEAHHTRPLHLIEPGTRTKTGDLAILCANCHRMIHARRPWLSVSELRLLVRDVTSAAKGLHPSSS